MITTSLERAKVLAWAAGQAACQQRINEEAVKLTPDQRVSGVLVMWQASTLFSDYERQWEPDVIAVRNTWVRLKQMLRDNAK